MDPLTIGGKFVTYFSYEEFFGSLASESEIIETIGKYERISVLKLVAWINTRLQLWDNGVPPTSPTYLDLVTRLFPNILGEQMIFEIKHQGTQSGTKRVFFHRRQIVYLAKLALRYCRVGAGLQFGFENFEVSLTFLKANDLFHDSDRRASNDPDPNVRNYAFLAEFISTNEYAAFPLPESVCRAYAMLFQIPPVFAAEPYDIDLEAAFLQGAGISLQLYFAMCMGLLVGLDENFYKSSVAMSYGPKLWAKANIPEGTIEAFWRDLTIGPHNLDQLMAEKDHGPNDFTIFRKYPLVQIGEDRVSFDHSFIVQKFWAGPFWAIFRRNEGMARFAGYLFENYVNRVLKFTCLGPNLFVASPKKNRDQTQLTDGMVICGKSLVLIEYKADMFTAEAKYSGDANLLRQEIEKKLLRNEKGRPKGVSQLHNAINYLETNDLATAVADCDLSKVEVVYPLLVTVESIGDCLIISRILDSEFQKLEGANDKRKLSVRRLHCTGISTLDQIAGAFAHTEIPELIDEWDSRDPTLRDSWMPHFDFKRHRADTLRTKEAFHEVSEMMIKTLQLSDDPTRVHP